MGARAIGPAKLLRGEDLGLMDLKGFLLCCLGRQQTGAK
jgi:hypothetical protein